MRKHLALVCLLVAIACAAAAPTVVWGADDKAEDLIRRAIDMRRSGDDQGAQPLFREAYDLSHSPRAAAQLGFCEQALGRWPDAESHLGESLRGTNDLWVKKNRSVIEQALVLIKSRIARLEISGEPSGADVVINGNVVGQLPLPTPVRVAGGEIEIELRAPGYVTAMKKMRVDGGQYQRLLLRAQKETANTVPEPATKIPAHQPRLAPSNASASVDLTPPTPPPSDTAASGPQPVGVDGGAYGSGPVRKSLKFVGWGLAAVALGVGGYGIAHNRSLVGEFDTGCGKDTTGAPHVAPGAPAGFTDDKCRSLENRYESAATLGVVGIVGAAVLTGAGFALWLTETSKSQSQTAYWRCFPNVAAGGEPSVGCAIRF
ncbi:MAG: PEGA domain-containing protein [Deltaproteobacteria bacterium]|nr:PEGA domain-containing protein [Deltaproteobacteria bacterium]